MPFRSVSFWQSALVTLPDNTFFELMRSILGSIKTPFNKQNLLEDLSAFAARPEIQEAIAAYIDDHDRRIIAAIALLEEPLPGELERFFSGEYSYAELHSLLLNLEERLIIYRFRDEDKLRIALNPRLEKILAPAAKDTSVLFPALAEPGSPETPEANAAPKANEADAPGAEGAGPGAPPLNSRTLAALFACLLSGQAVLKTEGSLNEGLSLSKKTEDAGRRLFPGLDMEALTGGLVSLGLLVPQGEFLLPETARLEAFKELPARECFEYLAGGIALYLHRSPVYLNRSLLKSTVRLIHGLVSSSEKAGILPETTLIKLAELYRREEEAAFGFMGPAANFPPAPVLLRSLVLAGLFAETPVRGKKAYRPISPPDGRPQGEYSQGEYSQYSPVQGAPGTHPPVAMDSDFSCILYPGIRFSDALDLAAFASVEETGTTVRFTLSRDSVIRGFNRGYDAAFMGDLLERLSGGRAGDALKWNLNDWEKRYREVSLHQGVVLSLGGEHRYLAETGPLAALIKQTLAPGVYLLSGSAGEAEEALHNAGVDIVARPEYGNPSGEPAAAFPSPGPALPGIAVPVSPERAEHPADRAAAFKERFRAALADLALTRQEREELENRIERRLIVSETQLKDVSLRYEKLEARSLDYVGKTGIARQAMASGSLLEITWNTPGTAPGPGEQKILGTPENFEKKGGEMILTVRPRDGKDPVKIPLGKISLLRRIKQSIFGE
ncbi:MAG: helicase-associated domain-containing protein [Spirochaetaceae bacterium]|jgi:hypothetical protein|nr:helicase-associated domain-containing protein [Spirochaetaceae bacterium]